MQRAALMIATLLALTSCGDAAGGPDRMEEEPGVETPPPDFALGGQTGSGRKAPCSDDAECEDLADEVLDWFTHPRPVTQLLRSECETPEPEPDGEGGGYQAGDICVCTFESIEGEPHWHERLFSDPGTSDVRLSNGLHLRFRDRAGIDFLDGVEFDGCDPERPAQSCQPICERYEAGWHAASARIYDITVWHASCPQPPQWGCVSIHRAEGQCYVDLYGTWGSSVSPEGPFDCSECAQTAQEVEDRWSCRRPVCGGEPGDLDIEVDPDAGVDCAER
jgi:hypothetical protein